LAFLWSQRRQARHGSLSEDVFWIDRAEPIGASRSGKTQYVTGQSGHAAKTERARRALLNCGQIRASRLLSENYAAHPARCKVQEADNSEEPPFRGAVVPQTGSAIVALLPL
jgi:hypothetical protein